MNREESFPIKLGAISRDVGNGTSYPVYTGPDFWRLSSDHRKYPLLYNQGTRLSKRLIASSTPVTTPNRVILQGRPLFFARLVWVVITVLCISLFLLSLSPGNARSREFASTPEISEALRISGISVDGYVLLRLIRKIVFVGTFLGVGILLFVHRSSEQSALFVSLTLITFGTAGFIDITQSLGAYPLWIQTLGKFIQWIGTITIGLFFYLFPDVDFTPRWTRYPALIWIVLHTQKTLFPEASFTTTPSYLWFERALTVSFVISWVLAQVIRFRGKSDPMQRQQIKWVVLGASLAVLGWLAVTLFFRPSLPNIWLMELRSALQLGFFLFLPISIAVAMFRYRLWDIDPVVNRTLVYSALTALVIGIYVLIVSYLSLLFRTQSNFFISLIATGIVAVLFQPLRERLQQGVNRLMYGERDEPAAVIARLGQRLEASLEPDSVLPSVVETIGQALKLPYVALALKDGPDFTVAAEAGLSESEAKLVKLPLTYQSETVGELIVAPRAANETFSPADKNLLSMLSQQAGVAAHAIRLTHELRSLNLDLQKSREQLVTAREEERRRIRRDLHDGVGPILASLLQRLDTVRLLIPRDPGKAASMAEELKGRVKTTIADIRRLVYALRPPVLDELGLISAIREYTADYQGAGNLHVTLTAPETLPHLPAAVEVAAYRIVLEAFSNVVHHSQSTKCDITIRIEEQKTGSIFCVDIRDNGQGLPDNHHAGVGIISMRERTAELGGSITIESSRRSGTLVRACMPFSEE